MADSGVPGCTVAGYQYARTRRWRRVTRARSRMHASDTHTHLGRRRGNNERSQIRPDINCAHRVWRCHATATAAAAAAVASAAALPAYTDPSARYVRHTIQEPRAGLTPLASPTSSSSSSSSSCLPPARPGWSRTTRRRRAATGRMQSRVQPLLRATVASVSEYRCIKQRCTIFDRDALTKHHRASA